MIRSYRIWSAVMGAWYLVAVASLIRHPPGEAQRIEVAGRPFTVPSHVTYFQQVLPVWFWVAVLAALALLLICVAAARPACLHAVHRVGTVTVYVYGLGYVASGIQLDAAWVAGGFALVAGGAHQLAYRAWPAVLATSIGQGP